MMRVAGFVLTGGQSTRMGRDKALLPVGSQTLSERIGDVVSLVAEQVMLVGHPERYGNLKYRCVADLRPGLGPLSGLETALSLEMAERSGTLCTVVRDATGKSQPLCGVYRKECQAIVSKALSEGRLRAMDLLKELNAIAVTVQGLVLNLNTPEDFDELVNARRK